LNPTKYAEPNPSLAGLRIKVIGYDWERFEISSAVLSGELSSIKKIFRLGISDAKMRSTNGRIFDFSL
jgi:hypothetical protein